MRAKSWWKKAFGAIAVVAVASVTVTGCDRDHFPSDNESKRDHQERVKDRYDVPTNNNDRHNPDREYRD